MNLTSTRRTFALRFGSLLSALGLTAAMPSLDWPKVPPKTQTASAS